MIVDASPYPGPDDETLPLKDLWNKLVGRDVQNAYVLAGP